jgi:hypothetical protein
MRDEGARAFDLVDNRLNSHRTSEVCSSAITQCLPALPIQTPFGIGIANSNNLCHIKRRANFGRENWAVSQGKK